MPSRNRLDPGAINLPALAEETSEASKASMLRVDFTTVSRLHQGTVRTEWAAVVKRRRFNATKREVGSEVVLTLVAETDQTPADLLRRLADMYEHPPQVET